MGSIVIRIDDTNTIEDIFAALDEIGTKDTDTLLDSCKKTIETKWETINKNYALTKEEAVLITSYTYGGTSNVLSPYWIINKKLREDDTEDQLKSKKSYLRLLLRALRKLPRTKSQALYRGIKEDSYEYKVGEEIMWKGFSSTSTSMKATKHFLIDKATGEASGTLFEIQPTWGYDISEFSRHQNERGEHIFCFLFFFFF